MITVWGRPSGAANTLLHCGNVPSGFVEAITRREGSKPPANRHQLLSCFGQMVYQTGDEWMLEAGPAVRVERKQNQLLPAGLAPRARDGHQDQCQQHPKADRAPCARKRAGGASSSLVQVVAQASRWSSPSPVSSKPPSPPELFLSAFFKQS